MGAGAVSSGEHMELLQVWGQSLATTGSPEGQREQLGRPCRARRVVLCSFFSRRRVNFN